MIKRGGIMIDITENSMKKDYGRDYNAPESTNIDGQDFIEILLVEDNAADVRLIKEIFKDFKINNKMHVVRNGVEAINYLYKKGEYRDVQKPDIVILDINLPKKDGMEVLYEIKTDNNLKFTPTIVLTTPYCPDEVKKVYNRYINCYIAKPFYLEQYVDVVRFIHNFRIIVAKLPNTEIFDCLPQLSKNEQF